MTNLDSVLHFARVVFDDESWLHHCWEFNVGVPFVLTLEFVQQCLVCGLRKTGWRESKGRSCKPNEKTFPLLSWPQKGKERHSEFPLLCVLQQTLLLREIQPYILKLCSRGCISQLYPICFIPVQHHHHCWSPVNNIRNVGETCKANDVGEDHIPLAMWI